MSDNLHIDVLDAPRKKILPLLHTFKDHFYLAGGTALALQIGHRRSVDFDFFTNTSFDPSQLFQECEQLFEDRRLSLTQEDKNTLSFIIDHTIKVSFFAIRYDVLNPLIETNHLRLLGTAEIGSMKILALPRAVYRDYVDLYFILQTYSLTDLIYICSRKFAHFDTGIYLKCLLSYSDIEMSPIDFMEGFEATDKEVFSTIEKHTLDYVRALR